MRNSNTRRLFVILHSTVGIKQRGRWKCRTRKCRTWKWRTTCECGEPLKLDTTRNKSITRRQCSTGRILSGAYV